MPLFSLDPPFLPHLSAEPAVHYRKLYRQYRLGQARGARGEIADLSYEESNNNNNNVHSPPPSGRRRGGGEDDLGTDDSEDFEKNEFLFLSENKNDDDFDKDNRAFQLLSKWRMQYRRFRQGHARGAEGELEMLANQLTREQLQYLPICQLKELLVCEEEEKEAEIKKIEKKKRITKFHIHFGAGKLGLGLVLPSIVKSNLPFAIYQKYSESWSSLVSRSEAESENDTFIEVKVNEEILCKLKYFKPQKNRIEELYDKQQMGWFICGVDENLEEEIMKKADTFTCALGAGIISYALPILQKLPLKEERNRPALYACENDHKSVDELAKALEGKVDVISCMVDRICATRNIQDKLIEISAEPYEGEVVVLTVMPHTPLPALAGKNVQIPKLNAEAKYFSQRKLLMVNGMHTTLAFMTLCEKADTMPPKSYDLINPEKCSETLKRHLWGWAVARCLLLLFEHDLNIIKAAHGVKTDEEVVDILLNYAKKTLHRFSTVEDTTGRVLSGGIVNRYQTRLKNVQEFMDVEGANSMPIASLLLEKAEIGSCELCFIIFSLVENAKKFAEMPKNGTEKKTEEKIKEEIKEKEEDKKSGKIEEKRVDILGVSNPVQLFKNYFKTARVP